jgi:hypothetical protein
MNSWNCFKALSANYPPCIRAICTDSKQAGLIGTLFIIPYTGGLIGNDPKRSAIYVEPNESHQILDAKIVYNISTKNYSMSSEYGGTFF